MVPNATRVTIHLVVCLSGTAVTIISLFLFSFFTINLLYTIILGVHQLIDWPSLVYSPRLCEIRVLSVSQAYDLYA